MIRLGGRNTAVDGECLTKAEEKFEAAFQKADGKDDNCTTSGDSSTVEDMVDAFLAALVSQITAPAPDCAAGETDCSGICVDLEQDDVNCGACGNVCPGGERCARDICSPIP